MPAIADMIIAMSDEAARAREERECYWHCRLLYHATGG